MFFKESSHLGSSAARVRLSQVMMLTVSLGAASSSWAQLDTAQSGTRLAYEVGGEIYVKNGDRSGYASRLTFTYADEKTPYFSRDGRKIVFVSFRDNSYGEIYSMNPDGTGQTRLTNNSTYEYSPAFNSNATKIVFVSELNDSYGEIYSMNADGTGVLRLTTNVNYYDRAPEYSPDGTKIVYEQEGSIIIMNANGTGKVDLTTSAGGLDKDPTFSPDGTKIAYSSNGYTYIGADYDIFTMNANGSNKVRIAGGGSFDDSPTWSPKGTKIAYSSTRQYRELYTTDLSGFEVTRFPSGFANQYEYSPSWSIIPVTSPSTSSASTTTSTTQPSSTGF